MGAYLIGLMGQVACSSDDEAFAPVEPLAPVEVRLQVVAESPGAAMAVGNSDVKPMLLKRARSTNTFTACVYVWLMTRASLKLKFCPQIFL